VSLPIVVVVTLMGQPRLQYAVARDGLIPPWFARIDSTGNLWNGTLFAGLLMIVLASLVPFTHINDMISAGILVSFNMTESTLILMRREQKQNKQQCVVVTTAVTGGSSIYDRGTLLLLLGVTCFSWRNWWACSTCPPFSWPSCSQYATRLTDDLDSIRFDDLFLRAHLYQVSRGRNLWG